jgi:hypothetical protein
MDAPACSFGKETLVWLDQLSKKYDRPISRLDEIPDEELDLWQAVDLQV